MLTSAGATSDPQQAPETLPVAEFFPLRDALGWSLHRISNATATSSAMPALLACQAGLIRVAKLRNGLIERTELSCSIAEPRQTIRSASLRVDQEQRLEGLVELIGGPLATPSVGFIRNDAWSMLPAPSGGLLSAGLIPDGDALGIVVLIDKKRSGVTLVSYAWDSGVNGVKQTTLMPWQDLPGQFRGIARTGEAEFAILSTQMAADVTGRVKTDVTFMVSAVDVKGTVIRSCSIPMSVSPDGLVEIAFDGLRRPRVGSAEASYSAVIGLPNCDYGRGLALLIPALSQPQDAITLTHQAYKSVPTAQHEPLTPDPGFGAGVGFAAGHGGKHGAMVIINANRWGSSLARVAAFKLSGERLWTTVNFNALFTSFTQVKIVNAQLLGLRVGMPGSFDAKYGRYLCTTGLFRISLESGAATPLANPLDSVRSR